MKKQLTLFLLALISLGLFLAAPTICRQYAKAQGGSKLDVFYTNNVEGYLEPCG